MTYEELIKRLDPAVYQSLKRALELGKWPDGRKLSDEQRSICMAWRPLFITKTTTTHRWKSGLVTLTAAKRRGLRAIPACRAQQGNRQTVPLAQISTLR